MNKNFPFTDTDLKHMELTMRSHTHSDAIWARAFAYYMKHTGYELSMACRPCYEKVYHFLLAIKDFQSRKMK